MEFLKGVHIHELDKIDKMGVNRKKLATTVTKLLNRMIFVYGFLHADPHSGNLMVRKKKGTKD
jgi:predicted unusual protein kinase regulating ubiquinone biosynthesis (AarF/ABC1/UbiB family)